MTFEIFSSIPFCISWNFLLAYGKMIKALEYAGYLSFGICRIFKL